MTKTYMTWLNYRQWQMIQNDCERCIVHALSDCQKTESPDRLQQQAWKLKQVLLPMVQTTHTTY